MTTNGITYQRATAEGYESIVRDWHQLQPAPCRHRDAACMIERRTGSTVTRRLVPYRPQDVGGVR